MVANMKRKNSIISADLKTEILEAAEIPRCVISEIAKQYNISARLIYSWRSKNKKSNNPKIQDLPKNENNFVEVLVNHSVTQPPNLTPKGVSLELEFQNFSFELKGKISSKKLIELITMLEQPC
ncbi:MAG: hypothetical protein RI930_579 [Pseudomonadota bacterium]